MRRTPDGLYRFATHGNEVGMTIGTGAHQLASADKR